VRSMKSFAEWNAATEKAAPPVSVLDRIFAILDAAKQVDGSITITDIAARTSLPKSTVSRLVSELIEQRYLTRTESGVTLGLRLFELGARANIPRRLITAAAPVLRNLSMATGERVGLWVQHGVDMVSVAAVPGRLPMLPNRAGMRSPALTTASGKAYLAFCGDTTIIERVSARLADTTAAAEFHDELEHVRSDVVAFDSDGFFPGVTAVASPVLSANQHVMGAVSIAGPSGGIDPERAAQLVRSAGSTIGRRLVAA